MSFLKKRGRKIKKDRIYWYYWRDENGKQRAKSLKTSDSVLAEIKKGEEDRRRYLGSEGLPDKEVRWDIFKETFLGAYQGRTKGIYQDTFKNFEQAVSPAKIYDVTYNQLKSWRDKLPTMISGKFKKPLSLNTVNIYIRNMKTAWNEAKRMGYIGVNHFDQIKQFTITKRIPRYLTTEEVRRLKAEAKKSDHPDLYLMCLFFLHTGIRRQELVNLKWASVDIARELMYLHGSETWQPKDREEHAIGLHDDLIKILKKRPKSSDYVFPGQDGRRCKYSVSRLFGRLYGRAGIKASGLHILRHTFATLSGLSPKVLQRVLGHSDPKTTAIYSHVTPEDLRSVKAVNF